MRVTIQTAKDDLSQLIERAKAGEDVIIAEGDTPVAMIVPIPAKTFTIGLLKGKVVGQSPDFLQPMPEEELDLWEGRR
jgi:prevent-host-death family protein